MTPDFMVTLGSNAAAVIADFTRLQGVVLRTQATINATAVSSARVAASAAATTPAQVRQLRALDAATAGAARSHAALATGVDRSSSRLGVHQSHIATSIVAYAALAAAATGAANAISLASTVDTESRRLEAVLNISPTQGRRFVRGLFDTAVGTATPVEDILSESDLAASAFSGLTDATERQAAAQELLNRAGQLTTITQRDMAEETSNLIALMKLGNLEWEELGDVMGGVVAAGNNSARSVAAIFDALKVSLPAAKLAGVSIEQLIALVGQMRLATQRDGASIGATLSTLFQTVTNEKAQANIADLTNGLVDLRDEAGNLRPVLDIMAEINSLLESGAIDAGRMQDIFKAFSPPLNPGAAKDVAIIFDLLREFPTALREVEVSGTAAVDGLVDKLNAALGPQFRILIEEIKQSFFELFGDEIVNDGQSLIAVMRGVGAAIHAMPPEFVQTTGKALALLAAIKGLTFVGKHLVTLLGFRGIATAAFAGASGVGAMTASVNLLRGAALRVLPVLAALAAFDFAGQVGGQQAALKGQIGALTVGQDRAGLLALREQLAAQLGPSTELKEGEPLFGQVLRAGLEAFPKAHLVDPALREGIAEVDRLLGSLEERGSGATATLDDLSEGFTGTDAASQAVSDSMAAQADEFERLIAMYAEGANATGNMTEAQRIEAEAAALLEGTYKAQAADLERLAERLRTGKITADEFAHGQALVAQAAQLAAQLVAAQGAELAKFPLLADAAAEGNEALTARLYELILASGGSIDAIGGLIGQLVNLAGTHAAVAASIFNNPIVIRVMKISDDNVAKGALTGDSALFARVRARTAAQNSGATSQVNAILDSINSLIGGFGSGTSAFGNVPRLGGAPRGGGAASRRDPTLFDLDDFPPSMLAQAIALATRLQKSIPGANKAAKDEILSVISDARFIRQIKGLDDALLRKSIDRLADIEAERLEEEKRKRTANEILSNLQLQAGPLGALISQPTFGGVGGSIPAGLNYDPQGGTPFTININSDFTGLTDSQLVTKIHDAIRNAIRDGLRLSGRL